MYESVCGEGYQSVFGGVYEYLSTSSTRKNMKKDEVYESVRKCIKVYEFERSGVYESVRKVHEGKSASNLFFTSYFLMRCI